MPTISDWFDTAVQLDWEIVRESPWSELTGVPFRTYPLGWLVPYVSIQPADIALAKTEGIPLWITDIHPLSEFGTSVEEQEGTFIINLEKFSGFTDYFQSLSSSTRKKFRAILNRNQSLRVVHDEPGVIDILWPSYKARVQALAKNSGGDVYTEEELSWRYRFFHQSSIRTIAFYDEALLVALNVSFWRGDTVFDLACLINPQPDILKRSMGTLAVLKNIELAISKGMQHYDLLSRDYGYKRQFGAVEHKLKALILNGGDATFFDQYQVPMYLRS